ncbi:NAD-dependent succinate-semialdehyde dehydrogenase [Leifsonia sp. H3M29-4]|uniref:NAD-dependent succinate-semialdehyde dehydrogenase n=1 Tax=Salinibacterium metalliresistens TaxID=3031321 RepID=UPI0023DB66FB|nr:NAD-dependent succinate-semialdehyde dehydrogenase [Salinibacterium metalliresistens]MDF1478315.1 NAD-dependent succinate-semialdehyde dehydrogenase [Salinibacterium metalliresistens]
MPALIDRPATTLRGHVVPTGLLIDGEWRATDATIAVTNPADGEVIAHVSDGTPAHALEALDAATRASAQWREWSPRARADLFHAAHRLLMDRADAFADVMVLESGKPRSEAASEFALSAGFFLWYTEQIAHLHGTYQEGSRGGYRVIETHQPVGPSFLVTPWNFPMLMSARKAGAALAAGCTVIMKSARETPLTAALFVDTLVEAGFPAGVVNLVHTSTSAAVSSAVMADERLRKVSFTGSTGVGTTLLGQAAQNIVNSSMELGGDGPFIVLDDADVDLAVDEAIVCKFRNAGQACVAANRIILHEAIADEFTEKFVARTRALKVGDGFDPESIVGPVITAKQRERVIGLVASFQQAGATLHVGGHPIDGPGFFYEPTVLTFPNHDHEFCNEELFAPVAALYRVASVAEAIAFGNDTHYGLSAYLFTRDLSRAVAVAERLDFGMVGVNRGVMADPAAPFGGIKASGLGREGGHDGVHEFLERKYIALTIDETAGLEG